MPLRARPRRAARWAALCAGCALLQSAACAFHRQIGPYDSLKDMERARKVVEAEDIYLNNGSPVVRCKAEDTCDSDGLMDNVMMNDRLWIMVFYLSGNRRSREFGAEFRAAAEHFRDKNRTDIVFAGVDVLDEQDGKMPILIRVALNDTHLDAEVPVLRIFDRRAYSLQDADWDGTYPGAMTKEGLIEFVHQRRGLTQPRSVKTVLLSLMQSTEGWWPLAGTVAVALAVVWLVAQRQAAGARKLARARAAKKHEEVEAFRLQQLGQMREERLQREAAHRQKAAGAKAEAAEAAESKQQARKASLRSRREEQQRAYRQDMLGMPS